jgi:GT2 family glycosyltransferase
MARKFLAKEKTMTCPRVSIIVLNWNGLKDTIECLESLKKITYPNYEVIVVDNGSKGNDAQVLEEKFGDYIHLIRNNKNSGYTGGNNIGVRYALTYSVPDYVLILNNDVVVDQAFLTEMVGAAADGQVGLVGPKAYVYGSSDSRLELVWYEVDMHKGKASHVGRWEIDHGQYDEVRQVDYVQGSCLLVRQEVIQTVGLFDEEYFCYWDETDYCYRVREAGYRIIYAPHAKIWHKKFLNLKPWYRTLRRRDQVNTLPASLYFMTRNNFKFMGKHATKAQYRSFLFYFFGYRFWFMSAVCLLYHRDIKLLIAFLRGVKDGLPSSSSGARHYIKG